MPKGMEYVKIDSDESRSEVRRQQALQAEYLAFSSELEAERQARAMKVVVLDAEEQEAVQRALQTAGDDAKATRREAEASRKRAKMSPNDDAIIEVRFAVIDGWVEAIEREHVAKNVRLEAGDGRNAKVKAERAQLERDVAVLESAHAMALPKHKELKALLKKAEESG